MPTIRFLPHGVTATARDGESLIRAAMRAGVHINASCGGQGVCGKCRVIVEAAPETAGAAAGEFYGIEGGLSEWISPEDAAAGVRLACRCRVRGDAAIRVPTESLAAAPERGVRALPARAAAAGFDAAALRADSNGEFPLPVVKHRLQLPPPSHADNAPDAERLFQALKNQCGLRGLCMGLPVLSALPEALRRAGFSVDVTVFQRPGGGETGRAGGEIRRVAPGATADRHLAAAIDIGTTTIQARLLDLRTGEILAEAGAFNGQAGHGEDVISRIMFSEKGDGLATLRKAVQSTVNGLLAELTEAAEIDADDIALATAAGNTVMTQLFLGVPAAHLRRSPYVPASRMYPPLAAPETGLDLPAHAVVLPFPQVSSYVGGDILAGVLASGMHKSEELTLFLDVGTNAEIVVGNKEWLVCAACSAGPAFEGGGVEFGMRAVTGAIEDVSLHPDTLEPMLLTVDNGRPAGICGSGLINITAELFTAGVLDNQGKFNPPSGMADADAARSRVRNRIRERSGVREYVLAFAEEAMIDRDVTLSEIDIENLIRAKGAIYSGCQTLLESVGLEIENLDRIVIAGGFGAYIDLTRAMTIGLLPEVDPARISYAGNAALDGATMCCLSNASRAEVLRILAMTTNFELSETPSYMDHYVASLFLPHTDLEKFPKLRERMGR